jgi:hypothetical protein
MIVARFGLYLARTGHDYEIHQARRGRGELQRLGCWRGDVGGKPEGRLPGSKSPLKGQKVRAPHAAARADFMGCQWRVAGRSGGGAG